MATLQITTPAQAAPTTDEPIVTRNTAGELRCTCQRFHVNSVLFGAGECTHTQAAELAARKEVHTR